MNDTQVELAARNELLQLVRGSSPSSPYKKRPCALFFAALLVVGVVAGVAIYYLVPQKSKDGAKVIPGPDEMALPPAHLDFYKTAAVSCDAVPCAESGRRILQEGGSAVDAAIATLLCMGVYNPQSMGLGGGFFMTIYEKSKGNATVIDARETAPAFATKDMYGTNGTRSVEGGLSVAVPGEAKGYWLAHQNYGKLKWSRLFEDSIKMARDGYAMGHHQARTLQLMKDLIYKNPTLREVYFDEALNDTKGLGTWIKREALAKTLEALANDTIGPDALYTGPLAESFVKDIAEFGGNITLEDLKNYKPLLKLAMNVTLKDGSRLFSIPPPGSGPILGYILRILDGYNFSSQTKDDVVTYQRMVEALKFGYGYRHELGDEDFENLTTWMKDLISPENADYARSRIMDNMTFSPSYYMNSSGRMDYGTAHLSVLAPNGDAVSATSTINYWYGAGFQSRSTGIFLNNEMNDFSVPGVVNLFGIPPSHTNYIVPGKRPMSSMCPAILVDSKGDAQLVIGAAGGSKIPSAMISVAMKVLWLGEDMKTAIDAPRLHHQLLPNELVYEKGFDKNIVQQLKKIGHSVTESGAWGSVVVGIQRHSNRSISASYDYRKGGSNAGW